jgi:DNA-binding NtrC family response regulator
MPPSDSILLVDDDHYLADSMRQWLCEQGFAVEIAHTLSVAQTKLEHGSFNLVLTDLRLGDDDGFELIHHARRTQPQASILVITGYATPETAVDAVRAGAFDVLTKPLIDEELLLAIDRATSQRKVAEENERLRQQLETRLGMENIISHDFRMHKIFKVIDSVADARASVLITGENGTGKSMIARAIHNRSQRRSGPFIEVACGALPDTLLESELFGHVAGAFTGATSDRLGKFDLADGGTLFLDEIGTASPALQVKLLRVLQELQFEPLGGVKTRSVDTRVILATNEDLTAAVASGRFRQDLFYRINVIGIELPALRERPGDIPLLVDHFLREVVKAGGRKSQGFDSEALGVLQRYSWPGNIRQLENVVERAVLLGQGPKLTVEDLPPELWSGSGLGSTGSSSAITPLNSADAFCSQGSNAQRGTHLRGALAEPERQIILRALHEQHWNRTATAEKLGINRTTLYKKMKRLGLDDPRLQYAPLGN